MQMNWLTRTVYCLLILAGLAFALHNISDDSSSYARSIDYKQIKLFRDVMNTVERYYVRDVTDKELVQGALKGMLQSLDPHSSFLSEDMYRELQVETTAEFEGVGIEISMMKGILTVLSPIDNSPAYRVGLKAGDKIIKINGATTKNISLEEAVKMMRGPVGTAVKLTIMRKGFKKFKDYTITRARIHLHPVNSQLLEPGYPYFRIANFPSSTDEELGKAIEKYCRQGSIKGIILDLRNNPGGLLDQAIKVSSLFVNKGLIVSTNSRLKDQCAEYQATRENKHYDFRMAVLINQGSASASEIVAGALQDHDRAIIFGTHSFGKASVQTVLPMEDGSALRLTTAHYFTPKKRQIHDKGIKPDVDLTKELEKEQLQLAKVEEGKTEKDLEDIFSRSQKVDPQKDITVKRALEWLKSGVSVAKFKADHKKPQQEGRTAWYLRGS
jgi:carboxyl-terminal processing protease